MFMDLKDSSTEDVAEWLRRQGFVVLRAESTDAHLTSPKIQGKPYMMNEDAQNDTNVDIEGGSERYVCALLAVVMKHRIVDTVMEFAREVQKRLKAWKRHLV